MVSHIKSSWQAIVIPLMSCWMKFWPPQEPLWILFLIRVVAHTPMLMLTQVVSFKPREGHKEESASNILNISQFHRKRKTFFCKKNTKKKNSNNNIDMKYAYHCLSMQNMSVLAAVGVQQTYRPLHCGASTVVARSAKGRDRSLRRATRTLGVQWIQRRVSWHMVAPIAGRKTYYY